MCLQEKLDEYFEWFHKNPELSYEEYATTAKIKEILKTEGLEFFPVILKRALWL